jgi:hypothetical protein
LASLFGSPLTLEPHRYAIPPLKIASNFG